MDCYTLANIFSYCDFDTKLIMQRVCKQFINEHFELYDTLITRAKLYQNTLNVDMVIHTMTTIITNKTTNELLLNGVLNESYRILKFAVKNGASMFHDAIRHSYCFAKINVMTYLLECGGDFMYAFDIILQDNKIIFIKPIIDCALRMKKCSFEITDTYIHITIHNNPNQTMMVKTNIGKELKELYKHTNDKNIWFNM